jgi:uncharacterized membrane protein YccC
MHRMRNLLDITPDTIAFPWQRRTPLEGAINTLALAIALLLGHITHHQAAAAIVAGAALVVGFAAFNPVLGSPLWSMLLTTVGIAIATAIGSLCAQSTVLTLVVVAVAAINYALFSHLTASGGFIAQQCGVIAIIAGYFPGGVHFAAGRLSMTLIGGGLQIVLHLLFALARDRAAVDRALHAPFVPRAASLLVEARTHTLTSPHTLAYTARLALTLLLCTAIYRTLHLRNGYWVPMTALLVLKPEWSSTLSRGIARLLGTVAGASLALLVGMAYPVPPLVLSCLALVCAFGCYTLQAVNYAAYSLCITLYIVFIFAYGGFSEHDAAHLRLLNTAIGGCIALTVDGLWQIAATRRQQSAFVQ